MSLSVEQWGRTFGAIAALGLAVGCGSEEETELTGLPMQPAPAIQVAEPGAASAALNTPPTIDNVTLLPDSPKPGERLTAVVETSDPEGDAIRLRFEWTVDGARLESAGPELMLKDVRKDSMIEVEVVAHDSHGASEPYEASVTVANRPPVMRGVVIEPLGEVSAANDIKAVPRSYDPDGDEVEYEYVWTVDGSRASSEGDVLSASQFRRGDEIVLQVIAYDGDDPSKALISEPIPVVNARPRITSSPSGFGGESFRYALEVEDPDGDRSLRFHLAKGPDGMSIDRVEGEITWTPSFDQQGTHPVEVTVEDRQGGEDRQSFELTLDFEDVPVPAAADR